MSAIASVETNKLQNSIKYFDSTLEQHCRWRAGFGFLLNKSRFDFSNRRFRVLVSVVWLAFDVNSPGLPDSLFADNQPDEISAQDDRARDRFLRAEESVGWGTPARCDESARLTWSERRGERTAQRPMPAADASLQPAGTARDEEWAPNDRRELACFPKLAQAGRGGGGDESA